ncbi:hypothetical protein P3S68_032931 [Capsicum galapagoense]
MPRKVKKPCTATLPLDVLSNLPAHVLDDILICLPLRDAVRTSILSNKWRFNWCRLPALMLDQTLWDTTNENINFFDYSALDKLVVPVSGDVVNEIPASFTGVTLNHLRSVKLEGISGTETEIEFIKLLLAKSLMLVRMLIQPKIENESAETRLKVLAEITKFPRASTKAEVDYRLDDNCV